MSDLNEYDKSLMAGSKGAKVNSMPLHSWDFFGSYFHFLSGNIADLAKLNSIASEHEWVLDMNDIAAKLGNDTVIIVTDTDIKIVFSSQNLIKMTGYRPEEVTGSSPKIFQGKNTSKLVTAKIREAIHHREPFEKILVNYRKDGSEYDCLIAGFPVFNTKGRLSHFIAFEKAA